MGWDGVGWDDVDAPTGWGYVKGRDSSVGPRNTRARGPRGRAIESIAPWASQTVARATKA